MTNERKQHLIDKWSFHLLILLAFVILVAIAVPIFDLHNALKLKNNLKLDTYSTLFTNVFIITVIVERFIEVFNAIWRRKGRLELIRELESAADGQPKTDAQNELDYYRAQTQTMAMYSGFVIGIIVGFAGVRALNLVFDASSLSGTQEFLFHSIDILLTAGLIAGGSKGINAVTRVIGNFLEETKKEAGKKS